MSIGVFILITCVLSAIIFVALIRVVNIMSKNKVPESIANGIHLILTLIAFVVLVLNFFSWGYAYYLLVK